MRVREREGKHQQTQDGADSPHLAITAGLDHSHDDVLRCHEGELFPDAPLNDLFVPGWGERVQFYSQVPNIPSEQTLGRNS